ncbi:hypothetical protein NDU88_003487 [Pleurodeles waltl]|uniref:Uncharacterized protein n=1 Tax=Pleurodeles waltl TaxID=8319 RepID=A0AAV7QCZ0_PLEWA|nr:hypothetical protein NDU88_003487 [Pleurodeles waltl]
MDQRVIRAMELLREAGRLDLIAAPAAPRACPARRAASGVAAAECSPPRGRQQVSGVGKGRSGRLALAGRGRTAGGSRRQPRPFGARRLRASGLVVLGEGREPPRIPRIVSSRGGACLCRGQVREVCGD